MRSTFAGLAAVTLSVAALAPSCGGEAALSVSRAVNEGEIVTSVSQSFVRSYSDEILQRVVVSGSWEEARDSLIQLYRSSEFHEKALSKGLSNAFCAGLTQLQNVEDEDFRFSATDWQTFLVDYVQATVTRALLPPLATVNAYANSVTTYWNLSQVTPALARIYLQRCVA